jgi:hypothetical protein
MLKSAELLKNDRPGPPLPMIFSVALYEQWKFSQTDPPKYSISSWLDVAMHVAFWVFGATAGLKPRQQTSFADCVPIPRLPAFVMEVLVFVDVDKIAHPSDTAVTANTVPFAYAAASLSLMTISFAILILLYVIHLMTGYSIRNQVDSYLVTIIVAGTKLSFFFVTLIVLFATSFSAASDQWRMRTMLSFIAKGFLIQQLYAIEIRTTPVNLLCFFRLTGCQSLAQKVEQPSADWVGNRLPPRLYVDHSKNLAATPPHLSARFQACMCVILKVENTQKSYKTPPRKPWTKLARQTTCLPVGPSPRGNSCRARASPQAPRRGAAGWS